MAMQGRGMAAASYIWWWWAQFIVKLLVLPLLNISINGAYAAQFEVGGAAGWTLPSIGNVNYSDWSSSQTFVIGDTLYFNYSKEYHNVMVVTKVDYEACDASNAISTFDDGATQFKLDRAGTFFFLCGVPSHCTDGQKVEVKVRKHALSSSASPSSQGNNLIPNPIGSPSPMSFPPESSVEDSSSALLSSSFLIMLMVTLSFLLNNPPTLSP